MSEVAYSFQEHIVFVLNFILSFLFACLVFPTLSDESSCVDACALFAHVLQVLNTPLLIQVARGGNTIWVYSVEKLLLQIVMDASLPFILLHLVNVPPDVELLQLVQTSLVEALEAPQVFVVLLLLLQRHLGVPVEVVGVVQVVGLRRVPRSCLLLLSSMPQRHHLVGKVFGSLRPKAFQVVSVSVFDFGVVVQVSLNACFVDDVD